MVINITDYIAEETQLAAEEKWLVQALKMVKHQRNCLQIERLHLESLKAKLHLSACQSQVVQAALITGTVPGDDEGSSTDGAGPSSASSPPEELVDMEASCNNEELNLDVSKSMFNTNTSTDYPQNMEEEEEEEDDCENILIDINMLMNATRDVK